MKTAILKTLLVVLVMTQIAARNLQTGTSSGLGLCDIKLYTSLKNPPAKGLLSISATMLDFFGVMSQTPFENAAQVWQRFATYQRSPFMSRFIDLTTSSFGINEISRSLAPIEHILSFNYDELCPDPCEDATTTFNVLPAPNSLASTITKKNHYANDSIACGILDNPFCQSNPITDAVNQYLLDDFETDNSLIDDDDEIFMMYKKVNGQMQYCFTVDVNVNLITHACEEYRNFKEAYNNGGASLAFSSQDRQTLAYQIDAQVQIDFLYMLSKSKFGDQLGRIYNDCRRFGPL